MDQNELFLGLDVGGTKLAWGVVDRQGTLLKQGVEPTPKEQDYFLESLVQLITLHQPKAVGIGIAGVISANHQDIVVCPNIPSLSHLQLVSYIHEQSPTLVKLDNDARCALIGEVWLGTAREMSSAVLVTLGTGVGGAVMQKGVVLPHPQELSQEIGRIMVDPSDTFPAVSGPGTIEAFLGGRNLEHRLGIDLGQLAQRVRKDDSEAQEIWKDISYFFIQCMKAIYDTYTCKNIIVGGIGSKDLDYYLQDDPPCTILSAELGSKAGVYGAARLAIDLYDEEMDENWE